MSNDSNPKNEVSELVEVHEEPVAKWRNLQVNIYPTFKEPNSYFGNIFAKYNHKTYTVSKIAL